jgi:hypothetical protein
VEVFAAPSSGSGAKWWVARGGSNVGRLNVSIAVRGGGLFAEICVRGGVVQGGGEEEEGRLATTNK